MSIEDFIDSMDDCAEFCDNCGEQRPCDCDRNIEDDKMEDVEVDEE